MSKYHIVTEVLIKDGHKHGRYFRVPTAPKGTKPDTAGNVFDYRSAVSINSFFYGIKRRNQKKKEVLYHCDWEDGHLISEDAWRETHRKNNIPHKEITYIEVDSIWHFYTLIGYDYKKKKYL